MIAEPSPQTVLDVLIRARARLAAGWCQHSGKMGDNYCSVHSLYDECTSWDDGTDDKKAIHLSDQAKECVYVTLRADLDTRLVDLVSWNDSKSRTQEEVLDLFDRTIERVKKNI